MRERSSPRCACAAKMLTCEFSRFGQDGRRHVLQRAQRQFFQHEHAIRRADLFDLLHQRGGDFQPFAIGDEGQLLIGLQAQAHLRGIARPHA